jgi:hypothetical protein
VKSSCSVQDGLGEEEKAGWRWKWQREWQFYPNRYEKSEWRNFLFADRPSDECLCCTAAALGSGSNKSCSCP